MTEQDKQQLNLEISHIFESGANHERIFNMVEMFIDRRYQALTIPAVVVPKGTLCKCGNSKPHTDQSHCQNCIDEAFTL